MAKENIKIFTPIKAIRKKCLECCFGSYKEIRECEVTGCALHPYRMGRRPDSATLSIYDEIAEETTELPKEFFDRNGNDE